MDRPKITIVVARALNGTIGRDKTLTMGSVMVMGRKTFESLPGLLPGRRHIVLTRDPHWSSEGATVAHSLDEALRLSKGERVSVIGGAHVFDLFLPIADRIELTEVLDDVTGDTLMPDPRRSASWHEIFREEHSNEAPPFRFVTLERS
jgi:dihydrofolate reductase